MQLIKFLFPRKPNEIGISLILLSARIIFGLLFLSHGIQKWTNFQELSSVFPDPIGVGSPISLGLAIFVEIACSIGFIFGLLYRIVLIPMIFIMAIAFLIIHGGDTLAVKELSLVYLTIFILLYITGPGKFSIDNILGKMLSSNKRR